MKLKLDSLDAQTILTVSEAIDPKQLPMLRAGVLKLLQQAATPSLILDLSAVHAPSLEDAEVVNTLATLRQSASAAGKRLLIVSNRAGLGDAATAAACVALLKTAAAPEAAPETTAAAAKAAPQKKTEPTNPDELEAELKKTLEALKADQAKAQSAITARGGESDEIRKLQRENDQIKRLSRVLEKELAAQLKNRAATGFEMPEELKGKLADIGDVLEPLAKSLGGEKQRAAGGGA